MKVRKAVFPVAGLGTRFLPATKAMPKEMLTIVDKPIIQYAVEEALAAGIEEIIFVTGSGKGALVNHFDRSHELECILRSKGKENLLKEIADLIPETGTIVYTRQNQPLGLGHAIWCARDVVGDEPFAVILADDLVQSKTPVLSQMLKNFEKLNASMVAVMEVAHQETSRYGIIDSKKHSDNILNIKSLIEKPSPDKAPSNLAIIGRYILTPAIFEILNNISAGAQGEIQLTDAMSQLLKKQPIFAYKFNGTRFDCGDKAGFQMANIAFAMERPDIKSQLIPFLQAIIEKYSD